MALFGSSQRATFKPSVYQPGKRSRRMPRWLALLFFGIVLGAGGVLFLQANYGPQRLTIEQSAGLHSELSASNAERQRLQTLLAETTDQRDTIRASNEKAQRDLAETRTRIDSLNKDLTLFQDAVPPDPRGGPIGIRAADLTREPNQVNYKILIMRDQGDGPPFKGNVQLLVEGNYKSGRINTVAADPEPLTLGRYQQLSGAVIMPEGLIPRRLTVRVLDESNKQLAIRIFYVR